jgi:hypothetical protein
MKADANSLSHDDISRKAYALWEQRGRPWGFESEIWLDAESQLRAEAREAEETRQSNVENVARRADDRGEAHAAATTPTTVDHRTATAEVQKREARAPQVPHHTGPKPQPAPPGKPIWSKAHSS